MVAKLCDRCGKCYFGNEKFHPRGQKKTAFTGLETMQSWGEPLRYDFCDDCLSDFFELFMEERKRDVQTVRG